MKTSSQHGLVNRKKNEDASSPDPTSLASNNESSKPTNSVTQYIVDWALLAACLLFLYFMTFTAKERASHRKEIDNQLAVLAGQFSSQRSLLTSQLNGLVAQQEDIQNKLLDQDSYSEPAEKDPIHSWSFNKGEYSVEQQQTQLTAEVQSLKEQVDAKQKELATQATKSDSFCYECKFSANGLRTTCGQRRDFLMRTYKTLEADANLAVIKWDANCATTSKA